jgi:hypothetical protein
MHANVDLDNIDTSANLENLYVPECLLLRNVVVSLSQLESRCFPQVYSVIRDLETNCGLNPIAPMDGADGQQVRYTIDMSIDLGNT